MYSSECKKDMGLLICLKQCFDGGMDPFGSFFFFKFLFATLYIILMFILFTWK